MCGIFGIVSRFGQIRSDRYLKISDLLAEGLSHRGPDGSRITILDDYALIGHARLAINDISGGHQPFLHSCLDGIVSVVNGEIYNYPILKKSICSRTHYRLDTSSDCEPLAFFLTRAIDIAGISPEGMYAAACYDTNTRTLTLSRDIFGEKPLYIYLTNDYIVFSSELTALAKAVSLPANKLDGGSIVQFMLYGYTVTDKSIYPEIYQITPGSLCSISVHHWSLLAEQSFWDHPISSTLEVEGEYVLEPCEALISSYVQQSTLSDVPLCIGLSGGLDSALIAALNRNSIECAFTVTYEAPGGTDEALDAKKTADYLSIPHEIISIRNEDVVRLFLDQVRRKDIPIVDIAGIGYAALYERIHERGYKVALMGHGGDEIFMGYPWLYQSYMHNLSRSNSQSIIYETLPDFRTYFRLLPHVLSFESLCDTRWNAYRPCFSRQDPGYSSTFDLVRQYWLEPNSLKMGDALSMSYSVESRHPLLSQRLFEFLASNSSRSYFPEAKWPLKQILNRLLPAELIQREKRYFSPPYMTYYSLISSGCGDSWRSNQVLRDLGVFQDAIMDRFYLDAFKGDWFDYYLFPRLATLHVWMSR